MTKTKKKQKKLKSNLKKNNYTRKQMTTFSNQVYDLTDQDVLDDYNKLDAIGCKKHATLSTN